MHPILRNILAVIAGIFVGGMVNMGIIMLSSSIIPLPEGVNPADPESLKAGIHLFEPKHFIFPFLAHALGTLVGAYLTALIAANRKMILALVIGVVFLIGGIINVVNLPAPLWFDVLDLVAAYIPMGWLGWKLAGGK
ncbi:MAG: hypothetical protein IPL49_19070 [Saprospirales bacterium]|nr:hypothetical protein [Saprospirales bacterium]MBK8492926.1 hypothetical protein [Saprospirales bacterium]